jgi:hypothetical protein
MSAVTKHPLFVKRYSRVQIGTLSRQGMSAAAVARVVGCGRTTVCNVRRALGITSRKICKAELRRLHADGLNDSQIAARLGVPRSSVWTARRKLRLPRNVFGRPRVAATGEHCRA